MDIFNDLLAGQLLVLVFLLFSTLRAVFKKTQHTESLAFFSVIAVFLSLLMILVYGLTTLFIIILCVSILVLISNIASLYRLANSLYTDKHSTLFYVFSYVEAFLVVCCMALSVFFSPTLIDTSNQTKELYTGSFSRGFEQKDVFFEKTSLIVTEYLPVGLNSNFVQNRVALVYLPSFGTTADDSSLRLASIAKLGLSVFTGDFYAEDSPVTKTSLDRSFAKNSVFSPYLLHFMQPFKNEQKEAFFMQKELELEALLILAGQKYSSVIIFTEGETRQIALNAKNKYPGFVEGVYIDSQDEFLNAYYGKEISDFAEVNPLDAYLTKFDSFQEFNTFRTLAKEEKPHLRVARSIVDRAETIFKEQ